MNDQQKNIFLTKFVFVLGLLSLMAAGSTLWRVHGGNQKLVEKLFEFVEKEKNVQLVKGKVKSIEEVHRISLDDQSGNVRLSYQPRNSQLVHSVNYDYIFIGFPLHKENLDEFHIDSRIFEQNQFEMQTTFANFVRGKINCSQYNLTRQNCEDLEAVFYTDSSFRLRSVAKQKSVDMRKNSEKNVFKIFSPEVLSHFDYEEIFQTDQFSVEKEIHWLAYPKYKIPQNFPPIRLNKNVFYLNAIEWSASCMEIEAIGARNAALLLAKELGVKIHRRDKHEEF